MNRKIVTSLLGLCAAGSLTLWLPTRVPRMGASVQASEVVGDGAHSGGPIQAVALPGAIRAPLVGSVTLTPLTTTEQYQSYHDQVAAALPHVAADDLMKLRYFCPADANRDDRVDEQDLAYFVHAWAQGDTHIGRLADVNGDGQLDDRDWSAFIDAYFGGDCSPQKQKEHRWEIC